MVNPSKLVLQYLELFSLPRAIKPVQPELVNKQSKLSEFNSIFTTFIPENAKETSSLSNIGKYLGQMIYKLYEIGIMYGLPMNEIVQEIHNSNLTKLGTDGKPLRRTDGKILNGPNYREPDIQKILDKMV